MKIGKTIDFQCHQMEHQLGAYTDCNHGQGLAVLHPVLYRHIYKDGIPKFRSFAVNVWGIDPAGKSNEEVARLGVEALADFIREMGLPTTFGEMGLSDHTDYKAIADSTNLTAGCAHKDDVAEVLQKMIDADVIVLASPVYFYSIDAQLKAVIDRTVALQETFGETPADPSTFGNCSSSGGSNRPSGGGSSTVTPPPAPSPTPTPDPEPAKGKALVELAGEGDWPEGVRFRSGADQSTVTAWVNGLELLNPGIPAAAAPSIASN